MYSAWQVQYKTPLGSPQSQWALTCPHNHVQGCRALEKGTRQDSGRLHGFTHQCCGLRDDRLLLASQYLLRSKYREAPTHLPSNGWGGRGPWRRRRQGCGAGGSKVSPGVIPIILQYSHSEQVLAIVFDRRWDAAFLPIRPSDWSVNYPARAFCPNGCNDWVIG